MTRLTLTILILLSLAALAAGAPSVRLSGRATVTGGAVRLADVATLQGLPAEAGAAELATLEQVGSVVAVDWTALEAALRQAGVNVATVQISGAARCRVERVAEVEPAPARPASEAPVTPVETPNIDQAAPAPPVQVPTLGERVIELLTSQLHCGADELEVVFDPASADSAELRVEGLVSITSTDRQLLGRRHWRAEITQHNRRQRRYLTGTVAVRRNVVVAARALGAGEVLTAADVTRAQRSDAGAGWMTDPADVVGQQVTAPLLAGQPIAADALARPVLVRRGQTVAVEYRTGSLVVALKAKALADGHAGERIELENPTNRRRIVAVVTGPGQAVVADEEAGR